MLSGRELRAAIASLVIGITWSGSALADERQSLEELRNTVINLLQALVDQGVISQEKASLLVKQAQDKAAADAAALATADEGAVRVPYVPQIVKDEISKQVAEAVKPAIVADVVKEAKDEKWGVPGALPDWLSQIRVSGSLLFREEGILYSGANQQNYYLNYNAVNGAGGIAQAGDSAFLDVNENRWRFRGAARLGVESTLSDSIVAGLRLSTGNTSDLVSPTQTLDGTPPYSFGIDNFYLRLDERNDQKFPWLSAIIGKYNDPWFAPTDLIFHKQLTFNGLAVTSRLGFGDGSADQSHLFLTLGAMPIDEVELSARDKWLYGAQLGTKLRIGDSQTLRFAAALYDYLNVEGRENALNSDALDYTAPQFFRSGNSLFNIRNETNETNQLFALASKFRLVNLAATYNIPFGSYALSITADAVKNVGFNEAEILARTGLEIAPRVKGYQGEVAFGNPTVVTAGAWRGVIGYRFLERDAVIDAYTDSDFHYGGTDAKGYYLLVDVGLADRVWMRLRYMSSNAIDGPTYQVDTAQADLNTRF